MLKIVAAPIDIKYAAPEDNLRAVETLALPESVDLLVLPELFSTGFIKNPGKLEALAESDCGLTMQRLAALAEKRNMAVAGSFLATDGMEHYYNRAFFISPDGEKWFYDKHHLFTHSGENNVITAGASQSPVVEYRGWRIKMMVCYDLRFPCWLRNIPVSYDILLLPSNWPEQREYAFRHLLIARAIENQAIVVGANRGGEDPWGKYPASMTQIFDWMGRPVGTVSNGLVEATVSLDALTEAREKFPVYLDAD